MAAGAGAMLSTSWRRTPSRCTISVRRSATAWSARLWAAAISARARALAAASASAARAGQAFGFRLAQGAPCRFLGQDLRFGGAQGAAFRLARRQLGHQPGLGLGFGVQPGRRGVALGQEERFLGRQGAALGDACPQLGLAA